MSSATLTPIPGESGTRGWGAAWGDARPVTAGELHRFVERLAVTDGAHLSDPARIDALGVLEAIKGAASAAQARIQVAFADSQRREAAEAGVPASKQHLGVGEQVALARRESPHRASRLMGLARALVDEMPCTMEALTRGLISEWRATILVRETAVLTRQERAEVDRRLADRIGVLSDRQLTAAARSASYELDPTVFARRGRHAASERYVALKPAPDTMARLTGYVPVAQGVAMYAALTREAAAKVAAGDQRSKAQIMADTLVERVTGQATAAAVPVEIHLVMTDSTFFTGGHAPADVPGYGPVSAEDARDLVGGEGDEGDDRDEGMVWVRRVYCDPVTGVATKMDGTRRLFTGAARRFLAARDQVCRTPYCGAPIRHVDHIHPASRGGPTTVINGQGLCQRCNQAKEARGWRSTPTRDDLGRPTTITETPTGHVYFSTAPPILPNLAPSG